MKKMNNWRKIKNITFVFILVMTFIVIIVKLVNQYLFDLSGIGLCNYKSISTKHEASSLNSNIKGNYNVIEIGRFLATTGRYSGVVYITQINLQRSYDLKSLLDAQTYTMLQKQLSNPQIVSQVTFSRSFNKSKYEFYIQIAPARKIFGAFMNQDMAESCTKPDMYVEKNIKSILDDMGLSRSQYNELKNIVRIVKYSDLFSFTIL